MAIAGMNKMVEMINWMDTLNEAELTQHASAFIEKHLVKALSERGKASLAVPGGKSPAAIFHALCQRELAWSKVSITLTDDRWVSSSHDASNAGFIRRDLLQQKAAAATFYPLLEQAQDLAKDALKADALLQNLSWPLDVIWLGVGADGHTASLFPSAQLGSALDLTSPRLCTELVPTELPVEARFPRLTLTLSALLRARAIVIVAKGDAKRHVLEAAMKENVPTKWPVSAILNQTQVPVTIFWSE